MEQALRSETDARIKAMLSVAESEPEGHGGGPPVILYPIGKLSHLLAQRIYTRRVASKMIWVHIP